MCSHMNILKVPSFFAITAMVGVMGNQPMFITGAPGTQVQLCGYEMSYHGLYPDKRWKII